MTKSTLQTILRTINLASLVLPIAGAGLTAALMWISLFITFPLDTGAYLWGTALLLPFFLAFLMAFQGIQPGRRHLCNVGICYSILLSAPAMIGLIGTWDGGGLQYLLALLPLYLWSVTVIMTFVGIAADALTSAKRAREAVSSVDASVSAQK